jgi:hypothetical protein
MKKVQGTRSKVIQVYGRQALAWHHIRLIAGFSFSHSLELLDFPWFEAKLPTSACPGEQSNQGRGKLSKNKGASRQKTGRKELRRQQVEREKRMRALRIWIPIAVVVLGLVGLVVMRLSEEEVEGAVFVEAAASNQHDASIHYEFGGLPPTGGVHRPEWQNCGIYAEPVAAEYAIHSMEHGAVWLTYHPDLPAEQLATLQDLVRGQSYLILSPYPDQTSEIVLTAWDVQLRADSAGDDRIDAFVSRYRRTRGPESAACSGGVGNPIG